MDLSPEVYLMSRDEMSSTSRSPDHHSGYGDYVEYSKRYDVHHSSS